MLAAGPAMAWAKSTRIPIRSSTRGIHCHISSMCPTNINSADVPNDPRKNNISRKCRIVTVLCFFAWVCFRRTGQASESSCKVYRNWFSLATNSSRTDCQCKMDLWRIKFEKAGTHYMSSIFFAGIRRRVCGRIRQETGSVANGEGLWWNNPLDQAIIEQSPIARSFLELFVLQKE